MSEETLEATTYYQLQVAMEHCTQLQDKLDSFVSLESYMLEAGKVDKKIATAMVSLGALDPTLVPVESFSVSPSKTNYDISMESMSSGRKGVITLLIAAVIALLAKLIAFIFKRVFGGSEYGGRGSSGGGGKSKSKGKKGTAKKGAANTSEKNLGEAVEDEKKAIEENLREIDRARVNLTKEVPEEDESLKAESIVRYYRDVLSGKSTSSELVNRFRSSLQVNELTNDPGLKGMIRTASPYLTMLTTKEGRDEYAATLYLRNHVIGVEAQRCFDTVLRFMMEYEKEIGHDLTQAVTSRNNIMAKMNFFLTKMVEEAHDKIFSKYPKHRPFPIKSFTGNLERHEPEVFSNMRKEMVRVVGNCIDSMENPWSFRRIMERVGDGCYSFMHSVMLSAEIAAGDDKLIPKEPKPEAVKKSMDRVKKFLDKLEKNVKRGDDKAAADVRVITVAVNNWLRFYTDVWVGAFLEHQRLHEAGNKATIALSNEMVERIRPILIADVEEHCQKESLSDTTKCVVIDQINGLYNTYTEIA